MWLLFMVMDGSWTTSSNVPLILKAVVECGHVRFSRQQ